MGLLGRKSTDAERAEELFSPYLDGQVTREESKFLEHYLAEHAEAREKFDLLKSAVQLTKALPALKAPRSFVLPRSMARKPQSLALRLYPVMRFATVAAVALFAFALLGDFSLQSAPAAQSETGALVLDAQTTEAAPPGEADAFRAESAQEVTTTAEIAALAPEPAPSGTPLATQGAALEESYATTEEAADATANAAQDNAAPSANTAAPTEAPAFEAPEQPEPEQRELQQSSEEGALTSTTQESAPLMDASQLAVIGSGVLALLLSVITLVLRRRL